MSSAVVSAAAAAPRTPDVAERAPEQVGAALEQAATAPRRTIVGLTALRRFAVASAAIVAFLALWEMAPRVGFVDPVFLPPFSTVVDAFFELVRTGAMWEHVSASVFRALIGFTIAVGIAIPLGLAIGWYKPVANFLSPILELLRNTAALALLPVFVLILGIGEESRIAPGDLRMLVPGAAQHYLRRPYRRPAVDQVRVIAGFPAGPAVPEGGTAGGVAVDLRRRPDGGGVVHPGAHRRGDGRRQGGTRLPDHRIPAEFPDSQHVCRHRRDRGPRADRDRVHHLR